MLFKRLISILTAAVVLLFPIATVAASDNAVADVAEEIIKCELNKAQEISVQNWLDNMSASESGNNEWLVFALSRYGKYDLEKYVSSLKEYLSTETVSAASSRLKYALVLMASRCDDGYIAEAFESSIGKQGIMSWVYGLHILNNGFISEKHTCESVIEKLLSLQLSDGGWAINGEQSDVDVTAMVLQSLATWYDDNESVAASVDKAISFLSSSQKESGDYSSYGVENPESCAQVIIALSSLGIDCMKDERFIKNGNNLFDVISKYEIEKGEYCHTIGGKANRNASIQVLCASVAYMRMQGAKASLYVFQESDSFNDNETVVSSEENKDSEVSEPSVENSKVNVRAVIIVSISIIGIIVIGVLLVKKRSFKNVILVVVVMAISIAATCMIDIQTTDEHHSKTEKDNIIGQVTITVRCDKIVGMDSHIPQNGVIVSTIECDIASGDTVYDVLADVTSVNKIHLETNGNGQNVYVEGIANVYEFDYGDLSGWVYLVNGERASVSCGEYVLNDGDKIEWVYSLELGNDI